MATVVDICNMALSQLGDVAFVSNIEPPEGGPQADHCARFYPQALAELLGAHPWSFATRRMKLVPLKVEVEGEHALEDDENPEFIFAEGSEDDHGNGLYQFVLPSECLRVLNVNSSEVPEYLNIEYRIENFNSQRVIVTKAKTIWVRYITSNVPASLFSSGFTTALVHRLAAYLAGPMVPGSSGAELAAKQIETYNVYLRRAMREDALQRFEREDQWRSSFLGDSRLEARNDIY